VVSKRKISVTVEERNLFKIRDSMKYYRLKNKSQAVEFHLKQLLKEIHDEG